MARRLFTIASAISLLLLCAVTVLWVRSYWVADVAGVMRNTPVAISHTVWSSAGFVSLRHWDSPAHSTARFQSPGWIYGHEPSTAEDNSRFFQGNRLFGVTYFDYTWKPRGGPFDGVRERVVLVPYWLLLAVFGTLPIAHFLSRRRRRAAQAAAGLCLACGYDLRATKDRCPECGTATPPAKLRAASFD